MNLDAVSTLEMEQLAAEAEAGLAEIEVYHHQGLCRAPSDDLVALTAMIRREATRMREALTGVSA